MRRLWDRLGEDGQLRACLLVFAVLALAVGVARDGRLDVPEVALAGLVVFLAWWPLLWRDET